MKCIGSLDSPSILYILYMLLALLLTAYLKHIYIKLTKITLIIDQTSVMYQTRYAATYKGRTK